MEKPLKNIRVVNVTINGGMENNATARPLRRPMAAPIAIMAQRATGTAQKLPASKPVSPFMISAPVTLLRAMTDVTDRSIPAAIKTNVWPMATIDRGYRLDRIFFILADDASLGSKGHTARK